MKRIVNDVRTRLDCTIGLKKVRDIRKNLNLPTDSDALAHLIAVYED